MYQLRKIKCSQINTTQFQKGTLFTICRKEIPYIGNSGTSSAGDTQEDSPITLARVKPMSRDPQNGQLVGWRDIIKRSAQRIESRNVTRVQKNLLPGLGCFM